MYDAVFEICNQYNYVRQSNFAFTDNICSINIKLPKPSTLSSKFSNPEAPNSTTLTNLQELSLSSAYVTSRLRNHHPSRPLRSRFFSELSRVIPTGESLFNLAIFILKIIMLFILICHINSFK